MQQNGERAQSQAGLALLPLGTQFGAGSFFAVTLVVNEDDREKPRFRRTRLHRTAAAAAATTAAGVSASASDTASVDSRRSSSQSPPPAPPAQRGLVMLPD